MKSFFPYLLMGLLIFPVLLQNLIMNGDFDGLFLGKSDFCLLHSNRSLWYMRTNFNFELQKIQSPFKSVTFEFYLERRMDSLCQQVTLSPSYIYTMNLMFLNKCNVQQNSIPTSIALLVNRVVIKNSSYIMNWANVEFNFTANQTTNEICLEANKNNSKISLASGPWVDNVTLVKGDKKTINIYCELNIKESMIRWKLWVQCQLPSDICQFFQPQHPDWLKASVNNEILQHNVTSLTDNEMNLTLPIIMQSNQDKFILSSMSIVFNPDPLTQSTTPIIKFYVNVSYWEAEAIRPKFEIGCQIGTGNSSDSWTISLNCQLPTGAQNFLQTRSLAITINDESVVSTQTYLDEGQLIETILLPTDLTVLRLKNIEVNIKIERVTTRENPIFVFKVSQLSLTIIKLQDSEIKAKDILAHLGESLIETNQQVFVFLKGSLFSYFLFNLISYWNLRLMFNLLNIATVPTFSKQLLHQLTVIFYTSGSLFEFIRKVVPSIPLPDDSTRLNDKQLIDIEKNGFYWFRYYGISSDYVQNNMESLVIFCLLIVKAGFLIVLRKINCLPTCLTSVLPKIPQILKMISFELLSSQIFFVVSSMSCIKEGGLIIFDDKFNTALQVVSFWFSLIIFSFFFIFSYDEKIRIYHKRTQKQKKSNPTQIKNKFKQLILKTIQLTNILIIPFLVLTNSPTIFLALNSVILIFKFSLLVSNYKTGMVPCSEKIFGIINYIFEFSLNGIYFTFLGLQFLIQANPDFYLSYKQNIVNLIKVCGFSSVFVIVGGGIFQLLELIKDIFMFLFNFIKKRCSKSQIAPIDKLNDKPQDQSQIYKAAKEFRSLEFNLEINSLKEEENSVKQKENIILGRKKEKRGQKFSKTKIH